MSPLEKVLSRLQCVRKSGSGWVALCPAHNDHNPSLSINETDEGHVLLHCFVGCSIKSITDALDLKPFELFARKNEHSMNKQPDFGFENTKKTKGFDTPEKALRVHESTLGHHSAKWDYHDKNGVVIGWAVRWETKPSKTFRPVSLIDGQWKPIAMPSFRPLYRLLDLAGAELVLVTEGEKSADAAKSLGFVATTSFGGSGASHQTSWQPLAGKKVVILPDNDEPGEEYLDKILDHLNKLTPRPQIQVVRLPDLPEKGDIVNWIENQGDAAEPATLKAELLKLIEATTIWKPVHADPKPDLSYRPFPLDILHEPIRSFVRDGANSIMCDPIYIWFPMCTALGAAIGNKYRLELKKEWHVAPLLWTLIVGKSGSSKTPAFNLALKHVRNRQNKLQKEYTLAKEDFDEASLEYKRDLGAWEKGKGSPELPIAPKSPQMKRLETTDTTAEAIAKLLKENPSGILLARDELSGFFGSMDRYATKKGIGADVPNFLSMYNAGRIVVDRKTNPEPLIIDKAAVSITGGIQPEILKEALGKREQESGFAARFLFAFPDPIQRVWKAEDKQGLNHHAIQNIFDYFYDLPQNFDQEGMALPIALPLTPEAKTLWEDYYNEHNRQMWEKEGALASAWSKLEEYPARIALILHFVLRATKDPMLTDPNAINHNTLEIAIKITDWCKHETERIYAMLDGASVGVDKNEQKLLAHIRKHGGKLSPREVRQGCRWLREGSETAKNALEQLVQKGLGTWEIKGERHTFILNPDPPENPIAPDHEPLCEIPQDSDNRDNEPDLQPTPKSVDVDTVDGADTLVSESVDVDSVDAVDADTTNSEPALNNDSNHLWESEPLFPEIPRLPD